MDKLNAQQYNCCVFHLSNNKLKIKNPSQRFLWKGFNCVKQFYQINFGYTQVLFMGSVPRINRLLTTVSQIIVCNINVTHSNPTFLVG